MGFLWIVERFRAFDVVYWMESRPRSVTTPLADILVTFNHLDIRAFELIPDLANVFGTEYPVDSADVDFVWSM
jgi:hypothetical protein